MVFPKTFRVVIVWLAYLFPQFDLIGTCEVGWSYYNGHCYYISTYSTTQDVAVFDCDVLGGFLAIISDANEEIFVQNLAMGQNGNTYVSIWIDGTDAVTEDVWRNSRNGDVLPYLNLHSSQPNEGRNANCLGMHAALTMLMDDACCHTYRLFACEMEGEITTEKITTSLIKTTTTNITTTTPITATTSEVTTITSTIPITVTTSELTSTNTLMTTAHETAAIDESTRNTSVAPKSSTTSLDLTTTARGSESCICSNKTQAEIEDEIQQMRKELFVDPKSTNKAKRKLISVPDDRPSAACMGYVGVIILCIVYGLCFGVDLQRVFAFFSVKKQ